MLKTLQQRQRQQQQHNEDKTVTALRATHPKDNRCAVDQMLLQISGEGPLGGLLWLGGIQVYQRDKTIPNVALL